MNIFVTVGHTRFDSLFRCLDSFCRNDWHFVSQMSDGKYLPKSGPYFNYTSDISKYYTQADLVISHAGAGTVFTLLEMAKPTIVVANTDRVDTHQNDLLKFVEQNKFAQVCRDLNQMESMIANAANFQAAPYWSDPFFVTDEIASFLKVTP
ncbi:PssE/Cps14G family polysaccharide biosynthesis glycosyltransferase [Shewanella aestuarii]|uniref:Glycosyltransferase n=1 Tax=Shewanella aestuarii TaxID=1028752 RepID=A0A6G9QM32_9GAMM|nr:PssE/Cps14G family polysaccharide biosynthesis glycosyltransferase [Shewanella aestuarii]QIR15107.1 glycosyltransferase [Shewanella aestuarii]